MTDIPIIFSAPMVLALLAGRKTMTRRPANRKALDKLAGREIDVRSRWQDVKPGDRLWVRETHWRYGRWIGTKRSGNPGYAFKAMNDEIIFAADQEREGVLAGHLAQAEPAWHRRPAIFLERKLSRLTLVVTAPKIEPLQWISDADVVSEGMPLSPSHVDRTLDKSNPWMADIPGQEGYGYQSPRLWFHRLWDSLHGAGGWDANPKVVALSFAVHHQNIDKVAA